ncbi:MAG: hypothetical protein COB54_06980 [Alphaproteobacteria bacterium]|nr:MAG: hypothetical protein COB54_06980 [Alphaproteobacteria bacterium]
MTEQISQPQVSADQTVSGWHVAVIVIGVAITLPAFLIGAEIMGALGTEQGVFAILTGGVILALIASACMYVAVSERLTTYQMLDNSFGRVGSRLVSLLISLTLLGWFGVTASLFGQAMAKSMEELFSLYLPGEVYIILGCIVMTLTTIYGFRAMDILSKFTVPLMLVILVTGVYFVSSNFTPDQIWQAPANSFESFKSFGSVVSVVVGSFMVGLTILPDIARFINRKDQIYVASLGSYGTFFPLILIMAGLPGLMTGEKDLIVTMYQSGLGVPALIMMIFASWTTNISNLYSCSLGLSQVAPRVKRWQVTIFAGTLGGIFALSGIMEYLIQFLILLGIFIPPVAGIYISHFFFSCAKSTSRIALPAIAAWVLASGTALATSSGLFTLTTIPALDALLIAMVFYALMTKGYVYLLRSQPSDGC